MKPIRPILLLALIGLQSALSQRCSPRDFLCSNRKCIRYYQRCDRIADCEGGEDEENCHLQLTSLCPLGEFTCDDGQCIELERRCDGVIDCPAASDEIGCPCASNEFQCHDGTCIDLSQKCDRHIDCNDESDEKDCDRADLNADAMEACNNTEFNCDDVCIDRKLVCDTIKDCLNGADELDCTCDPPDLKCSNGTCLPANLKCNGQPDCPNGEDENLPECPRGGPACLEKEFRCSSGQCIHMQFRCDGIYDCLDRSDEDDRCRRDACMPGDFHCLDARKCIRSTQRCDGTRDCADGSDEDNCRSCNYLEWACESGECIELSRKCDGARDCQDGSDEDGCKAPGQATIHIKPTGLVTITKDNRLTKEFRCDFTSDVAVRPEIVQTVYEADELQPNAQAVTMYLNFGHIIRSITYSGRPQKVICLIFDEGDRELARSQIDFGPVDIPPDERRCNPYSEFRCDDGECVSKSAQCNNLEDCRDGSDEVNCINSEIQLRTDPESQEISRGKEAVFQCRDEGPSRYRVNWLRGDGQPLPDGSRTLNNGARLEIPNVQLSATGAYVCEAVGAPRSADGARKTVYLTVTPGVPVIPDVLPEFMCAFDEATCYNRQCIPKSKVCDGYVDCSDGSDESRCSAHETCEPNMFMCDNRECVVKTWRCDNQKDCLDGSDEKNCNPYKNGTCYSTEFACSSGRQCIPRGMLCDKQKDCHDNSDEIGCKDPEIVMPPKALVSLAVGETLVLRCQAIGFPIPIINWRLNWRHVPAKCRQDSDDGLGTLTCPDMQIGDSGAYSCEAIIDKSKFAVPDANVIVRPSGPVCRPGTFNDLARSPQECIKCFCFGHSTDCRSANLYSFSLPPPRLTFPLVQVRLEPTIEVDTGFSSLQSYVSATDNGFEIRSPTGGNGSQYHYYSMPEDTLGNQLKSYGGYITFRVTPGGDTRRPYIDIPAVIIQGNGRTLMHDVVNPLVRERENEVSIRIFEGEWKVTNPAERQYNNHASRDDIMMVLEDIEHILIRVQYIEGPGIDAVITDINMDSATTSNTGRAKAAYVEECSCPRGYTGYSCERCSSGFVRKSGSFLGDCVEPPSTCPHGTYGDPRRGIPCEPCPCPVSNSGSPITCELGPQNQPICNCPAGYIGERCESCDTYNGFSGDPRYPPGSPGGCRRSECSEAGSVSTEAQPDGSCRCKPYVTGPRCDQCVQDAFFLSRRNQYGCIKCFCMGTTKDCRSSDLYRDSIETSFYSNSRQGFSLVKKTDDQFETIEPLIDPNSRELYFDNFDTEVYYWALSPSYLFDKVTSYGGNLQYTIRYTPSPGGMSSKNSAADVEIRSVNRIILYHFSKQNIEPEQTVTVTVPLLEQNWQGEFGRETDREQLLQALADISGIYIKATYTTSTSRAALISVSMDTATTRNTGRPRALEVEDCRCLAGYTGTSCEDCAPGYYRTGDGFNLGLCQPCDCNGHSDDCEPDSGECRNCRGNRAGANCENCAPGYLLTPDDRCVLSQGPSCNVKGTSQQYDDRCICKTNVEGASCDTCRPGFFHLSADNGYGCSKCYCSRATTECRSSTLFMEEVPAAVLDNNHGFTLSDGSSTVIRDGFKIYPAESGLGYRMDWRYSRRLFWSLPARLTGDKVLSYGGLLKFAQKYSTNSADSEPTSDQDVIITGNRMSIFYTIDEPLNSETLRESVVRITDLERKWRVLDQTAGNPIATREDILKVLSYVDHILVRASLASGIEETYIGAVSLETATQNPDMTRADQIEVCQCPPEYRGTSCQSCAENHYRDSDSTCKRCPCVNGRECSLVNYEVKCNCDPDWTGNLCDERKSVSGLTITMTPAGLLSYRDGERVDFHCAFNSSVPGRIEIREEYSYTGRTELKGLSDRYYIAASAAATYFGEAERIVTIRNHLTSVDCVVLVSARPRPTVPPSESLIRMDISVSPQGYIPENSRVTLTCAAEAGEPVRIIWSKQGGRLPQVIDNNRGRLTIINAQASDSGVYLCTANTRSTSETKSVIVTINVKDFRKNGTSEQEAVSPVVTITPSSTIQVLEGREIEMKCSTSGYPLPDIEWSRTDGRSFNDEAERTGGIIRIKNALETDEGEYECRATNRAGQDSQRVVIKVRVSDPQIGQLTISPRDINTIVRQTITITCNLEPTSDDISLSWRRNDRREFPRRAETYNGELTIRDIEINDAGEYVCEAVRISTGQKVSEASAYIRVQRGSSNRLSATVNPDRSTVNEFDTAVLQCNTSVPDAQITWAKVVNNRRSQLGRNAQVENNILRIVNVGYEDRAVYMCRAAYNGHFATARGFLEVRRRGVPPRVDLSQKTLTLMEGESAFSDCRPSGGSPPPTVEWSRSRGQLPRNIIQEGNLIRFNAVQLQDVGEYVCTASNSAGEITAVLRLDVQTRPKIRVEPSGTIRKNLGERLQLICRATGIPAPAVHWELQTVGDRRTRPETTSETGEAQVDVYSLSRSDAGYYTCRATSAAGQAEESVYVQIDDNNVDQQPESSHLFEVDLHGSTEITCSHATRDSDVEYSWARRDDQPLGRNVTANGERLIFHRAELSDSGDYVCQGKDRNGYPVQSYIATLNVLVSLDIRLSPEYQTVRPNDDAYIDCQVIGDRSADIRWEAVNRTLPRSATQAGGRLYFKNIQVEDAGNYACIATDRLTRTTVSSMARVTVKPPQPPLPINYGYTDKKSRNSRRKYEKIRGTGYNRPPCLRTQFKCHNGAMCVDYSKRCNGPPDCSDQSDEFGCSNSPLYNPVDQPPSVRVIGDKNITKTEGMKLFLQCVVTNMPNIVVRWTKEGSILPTSADVRDGELMINNLYPDDSGVYVCTARVHDIEASDSVYVRVEQGCPTQGKISCNDGISCYVSSQICDGYNDCPDGEDEMMCTRQKRNHGALSERVFIEPSVDRIRVGETVDLRCNIVGVFVTEHPQWEKVGGRIDANVVTKDNVLMIHDITSDNAGPYRCWVKKSNGQIVEDTYRLEVQADEPDRPHPTVKRLAEKTKVVQVYESVEIECDTAGIEPPVNFIWTRRNGQLLANQTGPRITLTNVLPSDAGEYLCVASNGEVKIEFPTFLVVKGTIPRFTQQTVSYLKLKPMAGQSGYLKLDILMSIKPERPNGLILYNGEGKSPGKDFIALGLRNSHVEFRFDVGSGEAVITSNVTVPMGKWSNITVKRERREGRLWVNGIGPLIGTSPGRYQGLDLFEPMYLGSVPNFSAISPAAGFDTGFVGCISFLKINNRVEELSKAIEKSDVSDCDTCLESNCNNNGVCQEYPNHRGFQCLCPRGFTGSDCQTTGRTSACYHDLCNEGHCVNTHSSYKCQCKLGTAGANCELKVKVNTPQFSGDSFLAYPIPAATADFSLYLEAKFDDVRNSLLAYVGQNQNGHGDFVSLTLRDQHIEFTVDTGSGPETIRNAHRVEAGSWLRITAEKKADKLSLNVNGDIDDKILDARKTRAYKKGLNLLTPLYLGGFDDSTISLHPSMYIKDGITGCVKALRINGRPPTHLIKNAIASSNVGQCPGASFNDELCGEQKCQNGGSCDYLDGTPVCSCTSNYGGTYCEIKTNQCGKDPNPCGSQGVCHLEKSNAEGYRCDCFFGFTGTTCQERTSITTEISFRRESYVELPGHLTQQWQPDDPVSISMTIQTEESIGLIFWQGTDGQYMSIGVKDGYIEAEVDHNDNPLTIRSRGKVDDARPHNLTVTRKASDLEITLDGVTVASTNGQPPRKMPSRESIFIGGLADPWTMTNGRWKETFVGCVLQLRINNGEPLDFSKHRISGRNVKTCLSHNDNNETK